MNEGLYIPWDVDTPGISLRLIGGRITIFRKTLEALGYPEFYRFLYNQETESFAVQACGIDDDGSHTLYEIKAGDTYDVISLGLVRLLYKNNGWNRKLSYRIAGVSAPGIVTFNLKKALEIHEGRLMRQG